MMFEIDKKKLNEGAHEMAKSGINLLEKNINENVGMTMIDHIMESYLQYMHDLFTEFGVEVEGLEKYALTANKMRKDYMAKLGMEVRQSNARN